MTAVHDIVTDAPHFEHPAQPATTPRQLWRDLGLGYAANGLIGLIFSCTGPVAVILAAGTSGGLTTAELASWIAGVFVLNGVITIAMSIAYRQPLGFAWTIPGTILVGSALRELTWPEVIGAFIVTGALILVLGLSGLVRRAMAAVPMPIVMAMVAGVFLTFGIGLVKAVREDFLIAAPMAVVFVALSAMPRLGRWMPPILAALIVGVIAVAVSGRYSPSPGSAAVLASPVFTAPQFTWDAALALVIPLAITVLVVQNGQGVAVLTAAGHRPPINVSTVVCGLGSIAAAMVGAVSTCLTGPTNALLTSGGKRERQYTAAIVFGVLAIGFGLFAPFFVSAMIAAPAAFVAALGGLAMLRALQSAFVTAFSTKFTVGALIAFVVTVADISVANIGAAFWGLVAGIVVSFTLERDDWRARKA